MGTVDSESSLDRQIEKSQSVVHHLLDDIRAKSDFPAVSQYITEINMKASTHSKTNAVQLAQLILKDYSLTTKLLKMVNSALYGQFCGQIATVSRAVVILGFEKVRMAATGLVFFEHLQNRSQANEIKQVVLSSFLSAILARDIASKLQFKDVEDIFICSMLHNLGRLLVMYYYPDEYDRIKAVAEKKNIDEHDAAGEVLGSPYNELGMRVAESWGLPKMIIKSMKNLPDEELDIKKKGVDIHQALASFSNALYDIAGKETTLPLKKDELRSMLKKFSHVIPFSEKQIGNMVDIANEKAAQQSDLLGFNRQQKNILGQMRFSSDPIAVEVKAEALVEMEAGGDSILGQKKVAPVEQKAFEIGAFQVQSSFAAPKDKGENEDELRLAIMNGMQEITAAMLDDDLSLDDLIGMIIETIYRGLGFTRVMICIKEPKSNMMKARYGLGEYLQEILRKFEFTLNNDALDLFNLAVAEGRDLHIDDTSAPSVVERLPDWYRGILKAPSFVLYPIIIKKNCIGLIYADMKGSDHHITEEKLHHFKNLRNQVVLAIRQK